MGYCGSDRRLVVIGHNGRNTPIRPPSTAAVDTYDLIPGVPYTQSGPQQLMDIYVPKGAMGSLPVVVFVHGGDWNSGSRGPSPGWAPIFTQHGYVYCSIDYRLSHAAKYPAQIEDCKCAVRFIKANASKYHVDAKRVGAWGASAGGHLVALLGTTGGVKRLEGDGGWKEQSSDVQAVIYWYGPTDLRPYPGFGSNPGYSMVTQLLGGKPADVPDLARDASPIVFVGKGDPPFLIMQGSADPLVPAIMSQHLYDALKAAGDNATLKIYPGAGHGGFASPEVWAQMLSFFDKNLKP